jgi:hypothetical protein
MEALEHSLQVAPAVDAVEEDHETPDPPDRAAEAPAARDTAPGDAAPGEERPDGG